jgi:hypothetical protein
MVIMYFVTLVFMFCVLTLYSVIGILILSLLLLFAISMVVLGFTVFWFPEMCICDINVDLN